MNIPFVKYRKIYFIFSGTLILVSLVCLFYFGLNPGIDLTGGSILEINYKETPDSNSQIREKLSDLDLGDIYIQPTGQNGVIIRMKDIPEETHQEILSRLSEEKEIEQIRFDSIGPTIGQELQSKTKVVLFLSLMAIIFYITFAFRKVSRPISSWQYAVSSLIALFHDVLIPLAIFSVLGKVYGVQITIPVITALITVFGYSINNTVVVFDRVRENLLRGVKGNFEETINYSLNQTLTRCINTSLTTIFVLAAIFFFGGETLKYFALALIIGILAGTYSSLFLANSVLISWLKRKVRSER
jgi:preprotein translocase subunit SecF